VWSVMARAATFAELWIFPAIPATVASAFTVGV
jgi:hypothetical protein